MPNQWDARGVHESTASQRSAAREIFGLFNALMQSGFTEPQALVLIGGMLREAVKETNNSEDDNT